MAKAKFLRKPNTEKVKEFLQKYITRHNIPKTIRTDPAIIFRSAKFKELCRKWYKNYVECPIKDHRGNGNIERFIRSINERLRTSKKNKKIVITKDKTRLSEIRFALRMNPSATKKSPYERYTGQEPNTIKRILTNKNRLISRQPEFELSGNDFESCQDSTIMVRERSRGSKLEGAFKKRKGILLENNNHTITFLPAGRTQSTIISKRGEGQTRDEQPCVSKWLLQRTKVKEVEERIEQQQAEVNKMPNENKLPDESETPQNNETPQHSSSDDQREMTNQKTDDNKEPIKRKTAQDKMKELKKRSKRQQKKERIRKEKEWLKKLETIISESEEQETETKENENSSDPEEREEENISNQQPMTRRGERARKKPDLFRHNIMVSQFSPTEETEPEKN